MVYLDHSATTPVDADVLDTYVKANERFWANASSLHALGAQAEQVLFRSNRQILELLQATDHQVVYTAGATESNNLAIKGLAAKQPGGHIITTPIEHPSVDETCRSLAKLGYRISYLDVTQSAETILAQLQSLITKDTFLVSIMHVNSEMGLVLPIKEIGTLLKNYPKIKFHVDAVQSVGKLPLQVDAFGIDLLSLSAHKIKGIKGVGALLVRRNIDLTAQVEGGGQMGGARSGTVNVPGAVSLAKALRLAMEKQAAAYEQMTKLHHYTIEKLTAFPGVMVNSRFDWQSPYIINLCLPGVRGETLVHALEEHHVYVSAKSACSSKSTKPSHVLSALGFDDFTATNSIRISFSHETTLAEVDQFLTALSIEMRRFGRIK